MCQVAVTLASRDLRVLRALSCSLASFQRVFRSLRSRRVGGASIVVGVGLSLVVFVPGLEVEVVLPRMPKPNPVESTSRHALEYSLVPTCPPGKLFFSAPEISSSEEPIRFGWGVFVATSLSLAFVMAGRISGSRYSTEPIIYPTKQPCEHL